MHVQAGDSDEVEANACDNGDAIVSIQECNSVPDSYSSDHAPSDCHSVPFTDNSLLLGVSDEIQDLLDKTSSSMLVDNAACPTRDGNGSDYTIDQNDASSAAGTITDHLVNDDTPAVADASTAVSVSGLIQDTNTESSNNEHEPSCDVDRYDPEANEVATGHSLEALVEEIGANELIPPAQSKEANMNDKPSRPDTILNWSDSAHDAATSKTKCAVQFENSVIFDLDVE